MNANIIIKNGSIDIDGDEYISTKKRNYMSMEGTQIIINNSEVSSTIIFDLKEKKITICKDSSTNFDKKFNTQEFENLLNNLKQEFYENIFVNVGMITYIPDKYLGDGLTKSKLFMKFRKLFNCKFYKEVLHKKQDSYYSFLTKNCLKASIETYNIFKWANEKCTINTKNISQDGNFINAPIENDRAKMFKNKTDINIIFS
jgi:hypothetical protein